MSENVKCKNYQDALIKLKLDLRIPKDAIPSKTDYYLDDENAAKGWHFRKETYRTHIAQPTARNQQMENPPNPSGEEKVDIHDHGKRYKRDGPSGTFLLVNQPPTGHTKGEEEYARCPHLHGRPENDSRGKFLEKEGHNPIAKHYYYPAN